MSKNTFCTSFKKTGVWVVKRTSSNHISSTHSTQAKAWKEARRLARGLGTEALLRGRDGKVRANNVYSENITNSKS